MCNGTVVEDYIGQPSIIQIKVNCPNCEPMAIQLNIAEVLLTAAIPFP
ncbi:hypothetical protein [Nostoc sp. FACHB-892]|nr:hypothetical protein [Nostoc sp. FACHB-892]